MAPHDRASILTALAWLAGLALPALLPAQVTFRLGDAIAAPGQEGISLPISIEVEPGAPAVQGWTFSIRYDPEVLGGVRIESLREADFFSFVDPSMFVAPGTVGMALVFNTSPAHPERNVTSENDGEVARLTFCVLEGARAGTYPIDFAFSSPMKQSPTLGLIYTAEGDNFMPLVDGGSISVEGQPIPASGCRPDDHEPGDPTPSEQPVVFLLGHAAAQPGQADIALPLSILVEAGAPPVAGWSAALRYDLAALGALSAESAREADFFLYRGPGTLVDYGFLFSGERSGLLGIETVYSLSGDAGRYLSSANDGLVARLKFCALRTALSARGAVEFATFAHKVDGGAVATRYSAGGESRKPRTGGGSIGIAGEPLPGDGCRPESPVLPPPRPAELEGAFVFQGGTASPGGAVAVPFIIRANAEAQGFSFSADFDEEVLQATSIERSFQRPDGGEWDFQVFAFDNSNETPGNAGVAEGHAAGAAVFSLDSSEVFLPRDRDNEVLRLHFRVAEDAAPGTTEVRFEDGAPAFRGSPPVTNHLVLHGRGVDPEFRLAPVTVNARIGIVGDITTFVRGDSNRDSAVDLSDAQTTLSYLFLGGAAPPCLDAADANDDGRVNISDPINTLRFLFLNVREALPPPTAPGIDPTEDGLECKS